ncbi:MAG: thermonuclease family protein [Candidatus Omnitrophica bacterium]|nr:thermonuclease family protein [Candidatus Omnitrophota bacterium]
MKNRKYLVGILFLAGVVLSASFWGCDSRKAKNKRYRVVKVFDGDTIKLANGEKVRLIGIDCPEAYDSDKLRRDVKKTGKSMREIQMMGKKAGVFTKELVSGEKVFLEFDQEQRDRYNRLLAYVWIEIPSYTYSSEKGLPEYYDTKVLENEWGYPAEYLFLNTTIVRAGYAEPMTIPPNNKYAHLFKSFYREARVERRGLWQ